MMGNVRLWSQVSHKLYGRNYIQVYISALVIIALNILLTNIFLNNEFITYALNVIKFGSFCAQIQSFSSLSNNHSKKVDDLNSKSVFP